LADVRFDLYAHHLWANERLLDACESLSDADLDAVVTGVYGSIRETLVHLCAAEARYLAAIKGEPRPEDPHEEKPFPGFPALRASARKTGGELIELAQKADPAGSKQAEFQGKTYELPLSIPLAQTINHGTEHRTNITTIMSARGIEAPQLDVWAYFRERSIPRS
jgi:uncharacterized damage-inducible protein DinB